jgi:hypothetical protein
MEPLNNWDRIENRPKLARGTKWFLRHNKRFIVRITGIKGNLVRYAAMRGKLKRKQTVYGFLQVYKPVLMLFLIWPLPHVESGIVHIPQGGTVTMGFRRFFKRIPTCSADKPIQIRSVSREWLELAGKPGERIAWRCQ